jgi:hypothetical protein
MVFMKRLQQKDTSRRTTALLAAGLLLNVGIMTKAIADYGIPGGSTTYENCFAAHCAQGTQRVWDCVGDGCMALHPNDPIGQSDCFDNALARWKRKPLLACVGV